MKLAQYNIYIIECESGNFYTGYTTDITRRYAEHVAGSNKCKYTKANPPKRLAAYWELNASLSDIMRIEHAIKKLSKKEKTMLINNTDGFNIILKQLNIATT